MTLRIRTPRLVNYVSNYMILFYIVLKCLILSNVNYSSPSLPPDPPTNPPLSFPPPCRHLVPIVSCILCILYLRKIVLSHYLFYGFDLFDLFLNDPRTSVQNMYCCITYRVRI